MYGGQYQSRVANNDTAIKLMWAGIISYVFGLITPQYMADPVYFIDTTLYTWDVLSEIGLGLIVVGIILTYVGITKARLFDGVKKFTVSGAFLVFIPILVLQNIKVDYRNAVGRDIVEYSIGYYALWLGVILSVIGSFKAISYPQYMSYGYNQQQAGYPPQYPPTYQQGQQQNYTQQPTQQYQQPPGQPPGQPPVQPPSYIEPEPTYTQSQPVYTGQPVSGNQLQHNYCGNCGQDNDIGVSFCVNCGTKFETATQ
ncbi:MAG: zinc ribbon domain-containing protein [Candidatus Heimdallarchaeota archaeon]|nr:zinc ribbon domain-containing protein [Candidatus Heimdallarchaeota archaeon]